MKLLIIPMSVILLSEKKKFPKIYYESVRSEISTYRLPVVENLLTFV